MANARARLVLREAVLTASGRLCFTDHAPGACGSCSKPGGCAMLRLQAARPAELTLDPAISSGLPVGQKLTLEVHGGWLLRVAAVVYAGLALLLVGGAVLGSSAGAVFGVGGDGSALLGAVAGLLVGVVVLRLYDSRAGSGVWSRRVRIASAEATVQRAGNDAVTLG